MRRGRGALATAGEPPALHPIAEVNLNASSAVQSKNKTSGSKTKAKPLAGKRVIIGRAKAQAAALAKLLREQGATVAAIPFIEIHKPKSFKPLDSALQEIREYDWLILTSVNGVEALFERMKKLRMEPGWLAHLRIAAIGPATKAAIEKSGLDVAVVPKEYVAESVVSALRKKVEGRRVLLVRAKVARDVIPNELRRAGAAVDVVEAYETVLPKASRAQLLAALNDSKKRPDVITFTSSSTARNFVDLIGAKVAYSGLLDGIALASVGPVTSTTLKELGLKADIKAKVFTMPGLVEAIGRHFAR
ncbi:MAG TPA: uroporphyrinogen-III synthase [Terriglobales bacterium]|nr:uroporphyrinogen-III synthase [Terriglobales bacterium]